MSALIALLFIIIWLVIGFYLGRLLHRLLKLNAKWRGWVVALVILAPVIQEVLGRIQFAYLCDKYAVVWLSPDWEKVRAARVERPPGVSVDWTIIRIIKITTSYINGENKKIFMTSTGLSSPGGLFQRALLSIDGSGYSCGPDLAKQSEIYRMIDIEELLKKGVQ
jgi:hypothetical protein